MFLPGTRRRSRPVLGVAVVVTGLASVLASTSLAQETVTLAQHPFPVVVRDAEVNVQYVNPRYVAARPAVTRARPGRMLPPLQESPITCYYNSDYVLDTVFFGPGDDEIVDWGVKACGASGIVTQMSIGVRTTALAAPGGPGLAIGVCLYTGTRGGGPPGLGELVIDFQFYDPLGIFPPETEAWYIFGFALDPPLRLPDGAIGVSFYDLDGVTTPMLARTQGGACGLPLDPLTGTVDCLDFYDYPASLGGIYSHSASPAPGRGSFYCALDEEEYGYQALAYFYDPYGSNPASYVATPAVLGEVWHGWVMTDTTGHAFALVFGFDTPFDVQLAGGQWLFNIDSGSGELLGLTSQVGPIAEFSFVVPVQIPLIGRLVGTQAIHFGGPVPFALSNGQDLYVGTY